MSGDFRLWSTAEKRSVVDYDNFVDKSAQDYIICINAGVLAVARKLIRQRGLWRTTYAVTRSPGGYTIPDDSEFLVVERKLAEFLEQTNEVEMCNQNLLDALNSIAQAGAAGGGCGCGSGDAGSEEPTLSTETVDPPGTPGGDVPPGFADMDEYDTYKCNVANWIIDNLRADVVMWSTATVGTMLLVMFVSLLLTPVPGARVAALLFAVVGLSGLGASVFTAYLAVIDDNRDDLLCALYDALDATDAKADFASVFEAGVDTETADLAFRYAIKATFALINNNHALNKMFEEDEDTTFPTGTCTTCQPTWWFCVRGTVDTASETTVDVVAVVAGDGDYRAAIGVDTAEGAPVTLTALIISGSHTTPSGAPSFMSALEQYKEDDMDANCTTGNVAAWDFRWGTSQLGPHSDCGVVLLNSNVAMTVRFTKS